MNFRLTILSDAEFDLEDIQSYYDNISEKLADRFFDEFYETIGFIENQPELYQVRYRDIRIASLYRFPYVIHYTVIQNEIIILRVLHTSRYSNNS